MIGLIHLLYHNNEKNGFPLLRLLKGKGLLAGFVIVGLCYRIAIWQPAVEADCDSTARTAGEWINCMYSYTCCCMLLCRHITLK